MQDKLQHADFRQVQSFDCGWSINGCHVFIMTLLIHFSFIIAEIQFQVFTSSHRRQHLKLPDQTVMRCWCKLFRIHWNLVPQEQLGDDFQQHHTSY